MNFKAIIFDLDGTLVNSVRDYADAANYVLSGYDFPTHSLADYESFLGYGITHFVKNALPACYEPGSRVFEKCLGEFRRAYAVNCCVNTTLYAGIVSLLDELDSSNISLNILTNKPHELALKVTNAYLGQWKFDHVLGHKETFPLKPHPKSAAYIANSLNILPKDILFVGDTPKDVQTANNAGMYPVGVAWGFRSAEELHRAGAKKIVTEPQQILEEMLVMG